MKTGGRNKTILGSLIAVSVGGYMIASVVTILSTTRTGNREADFVQELFLPAPVMAQNIVEGKGKVIAVSPEKQQVVLEHGEIKGFMEPMTMGYRVATRSLLAEVKPGDDVRFRIDTQKSTIVSIVKEDK